MKFLPDVKLSEEAQNKKEITDQNSEKPDS